MACARSVLFKKSAKTLELENVVAATTTSTVFSKLLENEIQLLLQFSPWMIMLVGKVTMVNAPAPAD